MVIFGKLAKLLLCYKRYVLSHPGLHLPRICTLRIVLRGADRGANGSGSSHAALSTRAWEIARRKMAICTPQY